LREARQRLVETLEIAQHARPIDARLGKLRIERERLPSEERGLSLKQVDAILELKLYRLTQLSVDEILKELQQKRDEIAEYESILGSDKKLRNVIIKELEKVRDQYGDARRTQIVDESAELQLEDLIADTDMLINVSHAGYIKRTSTDTYRHQGRALRHDRGTRHLSSTLAGAKSGVNEVTRSTRIDAPWRHRYAGRSMRIRYAAKTDVGMKRNHNEDYFSLIEDEQLFLLQTRSAKRTAAAALKAAVTMAGSTQLGAHAHYIDSTTSQISHGETGYEYTDRGGGMLASSTASRVRKWL